MQREGVIASLGNAMGIEFSSTVMPFILRGVRLIGVNSDNEPPLRERMWQHLATDMKPRHLKKIARVSPFEELPALVQEVAGGRIKGRTVIAVGALPVGFEGNSPYSRTTAAKSHEPLRSSRRRTYRPSSVSTFHHR